MRGSRAETFLSLVGGNSDSRLPFLNEKFLFEKGEGML